MAMVVSAISNATVRVAIARRHHTDGVSGMKIIPMRMRMGASGRRGIGER